ncbi:hypothetical protein ACVWXU_007064 [Streptomyces sp. TE33382]
MARMSSSGRLDDARHRADGLDGELADAGLAGEHHRVRAVDDRVGDVGGLGAGGAGVVDHRVEHLGGDDDRLGVAPGELDGALLDDRHLFQGHFDAEVAAGDHDAVEGGDDAVDAVDGLGLLDLGDDGEPAALLLHDAVDVVDVASAAHEGEGDDVGADAQGPAEVVDVLFGESGDGDGDAGEVEPLVVGDHAALDDGGADPGAVDLGDFEGDAAVVDEDAFAGGDIGREAVVGGAAGVAVAFVGFDGDGEGVTAFKEYGSFAEASEADLRALKVGEDAYAAAGLLGCFAYTVVALFVFGVVAVAEVEAGDVHSRFDECLDLVVRVGCGAQGTNDFCSAHGSSLDLTYG